MATRAVFTAKQFSPLIGGGPGPLRDGQGRWYVPLDGAAAEQVDVEWVAPQGLTGTLTLVTKWRCATATTGVMRATAQVEAITALDAVDTDAASSFDTANAADSATVPGTAGHEFDISVTLTNADSIAAGDHVRIRVGRDPTHANDNITTDTHLLSAELRDTA